MGFYLISDDVESRTSETACPLTAKEVSGYRYYQPSTGRWVSRDPLDDALCCAVVNADLFMNVSALLDQTRNIYMFVANDACDLFDIIGLATSPSDARCQYQGELIPPGWVLHHILVDSESCNYFDCEGKHRGIRHKFEDRKCQAVKVLAGEWWIGVWVVIRVYWDSCSQSTGIPV